MTTEFPTITAKRLGYQTAADILEFLQAHGRRVTFQQLRPDQRQKNRVLLEYATTDGTTAVVGGSTIVSAVFRAMVRREVAK